VGFHSNEFWPRIRILQAAFPGLSFSEIPVTGCDFLAYSCAAARDLHPLPVGQRVAGLRSCANLILRKSKSSSPVNLPATPMQSQTLLRNDRNDREATGVSPVHPVARAGAGIPLLIASS